MPDSIKEGLSKYKERVEGKNCGSAKHCKKTKIMKTSLCKAHSPVERSALAKMSREQEI